MHWPGIEPGSTAWKAAMLTTIPPMHTGLCCPGTGLQTPLWIREHPFASVFCIQLFFNSTRSIDCQESIQVQVSLPLAYHTLQHLLHSATLSSKTGDSLGRNQTGVADMGAENSTTAPPRESEKGRVNVGFPVQNTNHLYTRDRQETIIVEASLLRLYNA